jgi:ABC-type phosphate transport system auxiliary subunit
MSEDTKGVIRIRKSKNRQHNGQMSEDTKGVIRIRKSKKNRQYNGQMSEDIKGVIRIRKSKNNRQHNDQMKKVQKDKQRSPKHTYKTKDRETRTPLKTGVLRKGISSCSTSRTRRVNLFTNPVISHE